MSPMYRRFVNATAALPSHLLHYHPDPYEFWFHQMKMHNFLKLILGSTFLLSVVTAHMGSVPETILHQIF